MIKSVSVRRTVQVAMLTAAFATSGSAIAMASTNITSGSNSLLGGNQINAPISVPVNACGNAIALLGDAVGGCQGGATVTGDSDSVSRTSGSNSIGGGNQINAPISVPVNVCGNSVAVLGQARASCASDAAVGTPPTGTTPPGHTTPPGQATPPGNTTPPACGCSHPAPPVYHVIPPQTQTVTSTPGGAVVTSVASGSSLPTTGANFAGLLALAAAAVLGGGALVLTSTRHRVFGGVASFTRRAFSAR